MELAQVIGTVTSTVKAEGLEGIKLMVILPLNHKREPTGRPIVATDSVQAGVGDIVYWIAGREATLSLPKSFVPVDAGIVGIVDRINA